MGNYYQLFWAACLQHTTYQCPTDHLSLTLLSFENFADGNEANTEEVRERCKVKENILERGRLSSTVEALPRGDYSRGIGHAWPGTPQKSKGATKLAGKLGRIVENQ